MIKMKGKQPKELKVIASAKGSREIKFFFLKKPTTNFIFLTEMQYFGMYLAIVHPGLLSLKVSLKCLYSLAICRFSSVL